MSFILSIGAADINSKLSSSLKERLLNLPSQETIAVFVYLTDKGNNVYSRLTLAKNMLSIKGLQRRIVNRAPDDLVDFFDIPINEEYFNQLKEQATKIRHQIKGLNAVSVEASRTQIERISQLPFVSKIERVKSLRVSPEPQVEISSIWQKGESKAITQSQMIDYGNSLDQNQQINIPSVHELGYTGAGVVIAVFDSGFNRLTHEAFNQMNIAGVWDFVNNDSDVGDQTDMGNGTHGTNTLSTVGGYSEGNLIGPAYEATYYLAKTENTESELHIEEDNWCAAAEWADENGAQIITSSLGYTTFDSGGSYTVGDLDGQTTIVTQCAELAADRGIVVINSAGNSGSGVTTIGAPSDGPQVLAVGAVTNTNLRSSFSSVGPSADGRIKPDVMAMGSSVIVASSSSDTAYRQVNGTSFSCPLTAGVAALVLQANNSLTAAQVRDILRDSGDQKDTPDNQYGYGIIDALAAVESAIEVTSGVFLPQASFAVVSNEPVKANFTNTSTDSDGTIISFQWDLGDGTILTDEHVNHTYAMGGNYSVSLTVTDSDSQTDTVTRSITVSSLPNAPTPSPTPSSSSGGGAINLGLLIFILSLSRCRSNRKIP